MVPTKKNDFQGCMVIFTITNLDPGARFRFWTQKCEPFEATQHSTQHSTEQKQMPLRCDT